MNKQTSKQKTPGKKTVAAHPTISVSLKPISVSQGQHLLTCFSGLPWHRVFDFAWLALLLPQLSGVQKVQDGSLIQSFDFLLAQQSPLTCPLKVVGVWMASRLDGSGPGVRHEWISTGMLH